MRHSSHNHDHCWELIPWTVNGRASELQQQAVLAHAEHCSECRQELARHRALQQHMRGDDELVTTATPSWQKLVAEIDALPASSPAAHDRIRRPWLVAALWIQLVAIAALAGALFHSTRAREPAYSTLSAAAPQSAARGDVRIVFAPDAPLHSIHQLLHTIDCDIISGPSEAGVYTLALRQRGEVQSVIQTLRQRPEVLFAEKVAAGR